MTPEPVIVAEDVASFSHFDHALYLRFRLKLLISTAALYRNGIAPSAAATWLNKEYELGDPEKARPEEAFLALTIMGTPANRFVIEEEGHA